jgi:drug/metabolite transporter (DMT)-like permease
MALLSAALFGISTPIAKVLVGRMDPWLLAAGLYLGAGLGLGLYWSLRHLAAQIRHRRAGDQAANRQLSHDEAPLQRRDMPWLLAVIASGGVAAPVLLVFGLVSAPASSVALLLNLEGLFTMLIAWIVFREGVDRRLLTGALALMLGAVLLALPAQVSASLSAMPLRSSMLVAAACLCWAIDNNLTRKLSSADPVQITMIKGIVAGSVNLVIALVLGTKLPALTSLVITGCLGLLCYGLSLVLFVLSLRQLGAARTGAYFATAPFIGAGAALLFLGDPPTPFFLLAAALMAGGLYLHLTERHDHEHDHDVMYHDHAHRHDSHHDHDHGPELPALAADGTHSHPHWHRRLTHRHRHFPDIHHQHRHPAREDPVTSG